MKNLTICFLCQDMIFSDLLRTINEMGHAVWVRTDNDEVLNFCHSERISIFDAKETSPELIVMLDDIECPPKSNYLIRLCSSVDNIKNYDDLVSKGDLFCWVFNEHNGGVKIVGETIIMDDVTPRATVLECLQETLIDTIISLSRNVKLKFSLIQDSSVNTEQLFFLDKYPLDKLGDALHSSFLVLIKRYFGEHYWSVKTKQYLCRGRLDANYSVDCLIKEDFNILSGHILVLLTSNSPKENILSYPEAVITIVKTKHGLKINLNSNDYRFLHFLEHWHCLYSAFLCGRKIGIIDFLTNKEKEQISGEFNYTKIDYEQSSIIDIFDKNVELYYDKIAIEHNEEAWSYGKLAWFSKLIAQKIATFSFPQETPILIAMDRSPLTIAAMLGILRVGCCYVPLDPSYPRDRLMKIVSEIKAPLCITHEDDSQLFDVNFEKMKIFALGKLQDMSLQDDFIHAKPAFSSLAYIIYTSGSTGSPKGVMIEHRSIINLVNSEKAICNLSSTSRILNVASLGFDAAGWDIYGALLNGSTLVIAPSAIQKLPDELYNFIQAHAITFATLTPAVLALMPQKSIASLQTLVVMGDVCSTEIMSTWAKHCSLFNGYGPTETTIGATISKYAPGKEEDCIGKPLHNYQIYIFDQHLNLQPLGVIGEIFIGGAGLARGYYNNKLMTNERFIEHKINENGQPIRLYRTGDLGYWNENGEIIFVGRTDQQVKIHGVRIELREIEIALEKHILVEQAIVKIDEVESSKQLIAWITLKNKTLSHIQAKHEITIYLKHSLHSAAIPQHLIIIDDFPININGKIDRKQLRLSANENLEQQIILSSQTDEIIQSIFQNILRVSDIAHNQNIFNLGVHSLLAAQITARINSRFDIALSTRVIFENPTVSDLTIIVNEYLKQKTKRHKIISLVHRKGPLTSSQQQLWFLHQLNPNNTSYNLPLAITLKGEINYIVLQEALNLIVKKHETFRLIFGHNKGIPFQRAIEHSFFEILPIDINEDDLSCELTSISQKLFDLEQSPPISIRLYKISKNHHVLFFVKHNIITDAWSEGLIIKDLAESYNNIINGNEVADDSLSLQLIDIAHFAKVNCDKQLRLKNLSYWIEKLSNYNSFEFQTDYIRPMNMKGTGYRYRYHFKKIFWDKLQNFATSNNCTSFMLLVAVLNILAYKYTEKSDIVLGTAIAGRESSEIEKISGFFVNTLPLRVKFNPTDSVVELLKKTRETCLQAYQYQNLSFEEIVEAVGATRFFNKNPLFQVMIILHHADEWKFPDFGEAKANHMLVQTMTSMFDMTWNFFETKEDLYVDIDYSTELFSIDTIKNFIQSFEILLSNVYVNSDEALYKLPFLSREQQQFLAQTQHGNELALKNESIIELLGHTVLKYGNHIALSCEEGTFTYEEIWEKSHKIAIGISQFFLNKPNLTPHVAIMGSRNADLILAILATLRAGKTYIPIDPDYPKARIQGMLDDSNASLIISEQNYEDSTICTLSAKVLYTMGELSTCKNLPTIQLENIAYILYTSGSTGVPKGVMISHLSILNFCQHFIPYLGLTINDKFYSITTISFDIFGLELFCTLLAGAELILAHQDSVRNPVHLINHMIETKPSIMQATPTMWNMLVEHIPSSDKFTILCGGENLPSPLLAKLQSRSTRLINLYGPTETTIWSAAADLTNQKSVHIGTPISNTDCLILDEHMNVTPIGVWGNLYIGGKGLAKGYWKRPELTQSVFIEYKNKRLYRTGDRVKRDHDGNLIYGGRNDSQVKLRGHRIELGEIEAAIINYTSISEALVLLIEHNGDDILVGYTLRKSVSVAIDNEKLRAFLEDKLPSYMIPSVFIQLDAWPLTPNNKIDRKSLPKPDAQTISAYGKYVSPQNKLETILQTIWQSVLVRENISVRESFFSLGGNSLHIPQIVAIVNEKLNMKLTIREFILHSTIRDLSEFLQNKEEKKCKLSSEDSVL